MSGSIAVVGMACRYPDARSPDELWENVLAGRRAFRRIPRERLPLDGYGAAADGDPDKTYVTRAAVLEGYDFDRVGFRVGGRSYRSADVAHWLALDVAARALDDAGFPDGEGLPRETTGVLLGNSLTGEFSRASVLRLRWPYVRRVVDDALAGAGWADGDRGALLADLEARYKAPFPPMTEESLAGSLSNTIAGRICNHFDLKGGGYTVDGACASSLLAVITACRALEAGDLDVAVAGGVDVSLDPFELVGFARTGALARDEMRVYDAASEGFWPGEGCGVVVLVREADAPGLGLDVRARIRGWGVSSDGAGGLTRPEVEGQSLALERAYERAGVGIGEVGYFEGHGTGTGVGDATELRVLRRAVEEAGADRSFRPAVGSVKALIGHTKAAAGAAGLIKAVLAVREGVVPPTVGCSDPHPEIGEPEAALRIAAAGEPWPGGRTRIAGVSAMGFGGINSHVVVEAPPGPGTRSGDGLAPRHRRLLRSAQGAELLVLGAPSPDALAADVDELAGRAGRLSRAELTDLGARLARDRDPSPAARCAVVASTGEELAERLRSVGRRLARGEGRAVGPEGAWAVGTGAGRPRIGFLFPGQGTVPGSDGGALARRFDFVGRLYDGAPIPVPDGREASPSTEYVQPAVVAASLAGLAALDHLGIEGCAAVGHSLGELTALHWAGVFDSEAILEVAAERGRIMADAGVGGGAMASLRTGAGTARRLIEGGDAVVAAVNGPGATVISGTEEAVTAALARARDEGVAGARLRVSHAFHSPLVAPAARRVERLVRSAGPGELRRRVASTVTGSVLDGTADVVEILTRQVTRPVRFAEAVDALRDDVDLWVEVGPGTMLSTLVAAGGSAGGAPAPVVSTGCGEATLRRLLGAVGAAWALGHDVRIRSLFDDRFHRAFDPDRPLRFLRNPCEIRSAGTGSTPAPEAGPGGDADAPPTAGSPGGADDAADVVRELVASAAELPRDSVELGDHFLEDLHLNSLVVSEVAVEAARTLDRRPFPAPAEFADATVGDLVGALDGRESRNGDGGGTDRQEWPAGVGPWVRSFTVDWREEPLGERAARGGPAAAPASGTWEVVGEPGPWSRERWRKALDEAAPAGGVVVLLPGIVGSEAVAALLDGVRRLDGAPPHGRRLVVVTRGGGGGAVARSLFLETDDVAVCIVDVPPGLDGAPEAVGREAAAVRGLVDVRYDDEGRRHRPVLRLCGGVDGDHRDDPGPGPGDVVLVTGGGKGITAECALALARRTGAAALLLGRSDPDDDEDLAGNLRRFALAGVPFRYLRADVTDPDAVSAAIRRGETSFGPVTAVIHGAGRNVPALLRDLDEDAVARTLAPKVSGLRNVLEALDAPRLRLVVGFGSILARSGMRGNADYALANELMARAVDRFGAEHPECRTLVIEWSIWSGVGMGARLGGVEALERQGISAISPDEGIDTFLGLVEGAWPATRIVATGRVAGLPTLAFEPRELPLARFLTGVRVHVPGVELVADVEIEPGTDPYLDDHVVDGRRILPAVMGLEAMAQAAGVLVSSGGAPDFEDVRFDRAVSVPATGSVTLRLAALAVGDGRVDVALRSSETGFAADHFRATCVYARDREGPAPEGSEPGGPPAPRPAEAGGGPVALDVEARLYDGRFLFQDGRFRRLRSYRRLGARECVAEVATGPASGTESWFSGFLPDGLVLGDPGARDASLQAIQACIPHSVVLPAGVERIATGDPGRGGTLAVAAAERRRDGDTFIYDVEITDDGGVVERWEGLRLVRVSGREAPEGGWPVGLLAPYLERRLEEVLPAPAPRVAVRRNGRGGRRGWGAELVAEVVDGSGTVVRRPDGRPELADGTAVSAAHVTDLVVAVTGGGVVGCDAEEVRPRPARRWAELLGEKRLRVARVVEAERREALDAAATRVWTALEALKKGGARSSAPLAVRSIDDDGWVVFTVGAAPVATAVVDVDGVGAPVAVAFAGGAPVAAGTS